MLFGRLAPLQRKLMQTQEFGKSLGGSVGGFKVAGPLCVVCYCVTAFQVLSTSRRSLYPSTGYQLTFELTCCSHPSDDYG